jgi:Sporulation related domain.
MRAAFFVLLLANLLYFGWARWIQPSEPPPAVHVSAQLPRLMLASEVPPGEPDSRRADARGSAGCVSVGPFVDLDAAAAAASILHAQGLESVRRAQAGETRSTYWVYIGGLANEAEQARVLQRLERGGITDARAMPAGSEGLRVSVGLFSERARAERRMRTLERLGLTPRLAERRESDAVYWIDVALPAGSTGIDTEGLPALLGGAPLQVRECPSGGSDFTDSSPQTVVAPGAGS